MTDIPPLWDPASGRPLHSCLNCKHRERAACSAFPQGIPFDIMSGVTPHDKPIRGDHGIQWEADPRAPLGVTPEEAALLEELWQGKAR